MCESEEIFYEDERRLKESGVRNVFTPHTPINQENLFRGRITEVQQILSTLNTPGQHVGEFYQFNLSSCIRQQNSLTAQFVSFSLSNLANIFYPPQFLQ